MANQTKSTKSVKASEIKRSWHVINLDGKVLGRAAQEIATLLQGKKKVNFVPYLDLGDNVVVINAKKVVVTGKKADTKVYTRYSGYPGGLRSDTFNELMNRKPDEVIRRAVSGMLPKNKLRDVRLARLHVYPDDKHPYQDKVQTNK